MGFRAALDTCNCEKDCTIRWLCRIADYVEDRPGLEALIERLTIWYIGKRNRVRRLLGR